MYKENINNIIKNLVNKVKNIEENKKIFQTEKTKLYRILAIKFKKKIKKKKLSINSYITYMIRARRQFLNIKHHNFNKKIIFLKKKFKWYIKEINEIYKEKNIKKIIYKIKLLKKKLNNIYYIKKYLNKIKIFSNNNKNIKIIKNIILNFPEWKKELKKIKKKKWYYSNKYIINKMQYGKNFLKKIEKFKINHEILFNLKIEKKKLYLSKKKSYEKLKEKKKNTITINYINYINEINNILNKKTKLNKINEISELSFSLSAISGRRMIEIIKTGKFKKTNKYNKIYFYGQAKNFKKKYKIYILIYNSDFFIKKIKKIRKSIIIKKIIYKIKKKKNKFISINNQISNNLSNKFNKWVKKFFKDKKRSYKDSRSIYSRIAFEEWFKKDKKWKKYDEDMFFYKILGHTNINSQISYKQFKLFKFINNYKPYKKKNKRLINLLKLDNKLNKVIKKKTSYKIHEITKKIIKKKPDIVITNYLLRKYGFNTRLIQRYIKYISKHIKQKIKKGRYIIKKKKIIIKK